MRENRDKQDQEELQAWVKQTLKAAVGELIDKGAFESLLVEAKPAWVFPFRVLIGRIREKGQSKLFDWFICGEVPTDLVDSRTASSPHEAARYFAMKWQLEAARQQVLSEQADQAEALYALVEDEALWQQK